MIESGRYEKVLVIGSDVMSSIIDYEDRNTCVLFGDAAGAVLLEPCPEAGYGILDFIHRIDGSGGKHLHMKAGGSRRPSSLETVKNKEHYVYQEGQQVFKFAVKEMANVSAQILEKNGLTGEDVAFFLPHQANLRIIEASANRMGIDRSKVVINIERYANTTAATIPLCLYDVLVEEKTREEGRLPRDVGFWRRLHLGERAHALVGVKCALGSWLFAFVPTTTFGTIFLRSPQRPPRAQRLSLSSSLQSRRAPR